MGLPLITKAGSQLLKLGGRLGKHVWSNAGPKTFGDAAAIFGPDVFFGAMAGMNTPGDTTDKVIAGLGAGVGGAVGGVALRGVLPKGLVGPGLGTLIDMGGSVGGDMLGMAAADQVLRVKGGGTTPWEKVQAQQYEQMKKQAKDEIIQELLQQQRAQRSQFGLY